MFYYFVLYDALTLNETYRDLLFPQYYLRYHGETQQLVIYQRQKNLQIVSVWLFSSLNYFERDQREPRVAAARTAASSPLPTSHLHPSNLRHMWHCSLISTSCSRQTSPPFPRRRSDLWPAWTTRRARSTTRRVGPSPPWPEWWWSALQGRCVRWWRDCSRHTAKGQTPTSRVRSAFQVSPQENFASKDIIYVQL